MESNNPGHPPGHESGSTSGTGELRYRKPFPIVTAIICAICIGLFIGVNLPWANGTGYDLMYWGAPSVIQIFKGHFWGLITSNFLHLALWHIAFNLYWTWIFGRKIELISGRLAFAGIVLTAAIVSSAAQMAFSDNTGIGLSGIGYALFGYILVSQRTRNEYKDALSNRTIGLFLFWLVLCFVITKAEILVIGNAAHVGGLLWGMGLAFISRFSKPVQWVARVSGLCLLLSMMYWSPFSTCYLSYKAFTLQEHKHLEEARLVYEQILKKDPQSEFAIINLNRIEIYNLSQKAYELHRMGKYAEAREVYNEILLIDENDEWAKTNLKMLPGK